MIKEIARTIYPIPQPKMGVAWETTDGTIFNIKEEATAHEAKYQEARSRLDMSNRSFIVGFPVDIFVVFPNHEDSSDNKYGAYVLEYDYEGYPNGIIRYDQEDLKSKITYLKKEISDIEFLIQKLEEYKGD